MCSTFLARSRLCIRRPSSAGLFFVYQESGQESDQSASTRSVHIVPHAPTVDLGMSTAEPVEPEAEQPTSSNTVAGLRPDTENHNLTVKRQGRNPSANSTTISECLVGDETGTVILTARNEQAELAKPGKILALKGAKVDMFKSSLRLMVPPSGSIEVSEASKLEPKVDNNVSLIEYELVPIITN